MTETDDRETSRSEGHLGRSEAERSDAPGLLGYLRLLLRHRYLIAGLTIGAALIAVILGSLGPRQYRAEASFTPQGTEQPGTSRLSGVAARFGVDVGGGTSPNQSPEFYRRLLTSREILRAVARDSYPSPAPGDSAHRTLLEIWDLGDQPGDEGLDAAVRRLKASVSPTTDRETSMVTFGITADDPGLARALAHRLLDQVNRFNVEQRQSRAAAERAFLEERVEQARERLRAAEDSLRIFLENNRAFNNSPTLAFERDRLRRRVERQQQLYNSLSQSLEESRINEIRNTPVITVVERPEGSVRPVPRNRVTLALTGMILGGTVGILLALGREYLRGARRTDPENYSALVEMWRQTVRDVRDALARFRGMVRSS